MQRYFYASFPLARSRALGVNEQACFRAPALSTHAAALRAADRPRLGPGSLPYRTFGPRKQGPASSPLGCGVQVDHLTSRIGKLLSSRQTGSSPLHPSRCPLVAILPLFPRRFQLPIPVDLNLLLMPGEHAHRSEIGTPSTKCRLRIATFSSGV